MENKIINLVDIVDLHKYYYTNNTVFALNGVSFQIKNNETLAIVGESGCGKTTLAKTICRIHEPTSGAINYLGADISHLKWGKLKPYRRKIQYIFQNPFSSLNPAMTVYDNISRGIIIHNLAKKNELKEKVIILAKEIGLSAEHLERFPHEFSGGQKQRIAIARAIALEPELIILDEPTSSLDVSVQSQVINLLIRLKVQKGYTYIFITHNLILAQYVSDRVAIMYLGKIVELADREDIFFGKSLHPYSQCLLSAIPSIGTQEKKKRIILKGSPPDQTILPKGCKFASRCPIKQEKCENLEPELIDVGSNHSVACFYPKKI